MQAEKGNEKIKVMVIGLDGATFDILSPLISQGKLPSLESLIQNGASGNLKSTMPPLSPAAWSTFQTGKNPGKHGVFDFFKSLPGDHSYLPVNSTLLKSKTLWEIVSDYGRSVGVLNIMLNYPPRKVNGFIVTGKETPSEDSEYTSPPALKKEILQVEPKYEAEPFKRISKTRRFLKEVPVFLNRQEKINSYLYKKYSPDLFANLFAIPDVIHHVFWKYMDPSHPNYSERESRTYLPLIEKCYQTLDDIIGSRLKMIDENTVVIVMSDHGGGPLHKFVQLNRWLQTQGLMTLKNDRKSRDSSFVGGLKHLLRRLYSYALVYDFTGFFKKLRLDTFAKRMASAQSAIDWTRTKAFAGRISEHGIYCNLKEREKEGIVSPEEYEELRQNIISKLSELKDPYTGKRVFEKVYKREEIYTGPYITYAPDIILGFGNEPYEPGDDLFGEEILESVRNDGFTGMHRPDGIMIAYGQGIKRAAVIHGAEIGDLAPTILYAMGEKIPRDMDGKVLLGIFEPSFVKMHPVTYDNKERQGSQPSENELTYNEEEAESIKERLKLLGYLK